MIRRSAILVAMSALALAGPGAISKASAQDLPDSQFYVRNTLVEALSCRVRVPGNAWEKRFSILAGSEFRRRAPGENARLELTCRSPVPATPYRLVPGERYAFIKLPGKEVALRKIVDED